VAFFELHYPDEISPTKSWTPTYAPVARGRSKVTIKTGIASQAAADGVTVWKQQFAPRMQEWAESFALISDADVAGWLDFEATVLGSAFRMKAPNTGGAYVWVKIAPGQDGDIETLSDDYPGFYSATLRFVEVAQPSGS